VKLYREGYENVSDASCSCQWDVLSILNGGQILPIQFQCAEEIIPMCRIERLSVYRFSD
jgi:hypothetical protein